VLAARLLVKYPNVDVISSEQSNTVKQITSLLTKRKKRIELGLTVVEGPRIVLDLLKNENTRGLVRQAVVACDKSEWMAEVLKFEDVHVCEGTPAVLAKCSDTMTPQGIVATVQIPPEPSREAPPSRSANPLYLVLDGVSDPGNVGTLLRSSVAVGVAAVILMPGCCDVWNPKAVRSAMGCSFQVPILSVGSLNEALDVLDTWKVHDVFAATMEDSGNASSTAHHEVDWAQHASALLIGSEGNGLSKEVRDLVASGQLRSLHVPMESGIESLNAAVCGSVILFEYHRKKTTIDPTG